MTQGHFVWRDLMSTDVDAAKAFYSELFGWKPVVQNMGPLGDYLMFSREGTPETSFCGVAKLDAAAKMPSHWITYLSVDDLDGACEKITELGGSIPVKPFEIPNIGRTAVAQAPGGEYFSPFVSANPDYEPNTDAPADFDFCWSQLMTRDEAQASAFYEAIVGWKGEAMEGGDQQTVFMDGERPAASAMTIPEGSPSPPNWLNYVAVPDVQQYHDKAVALGATSHHNTTDIPGMGTFAILGGPDGGVIALWKDASAAS